MDLVARPGAGSVGARRGVHLFGDDTIVRAHSRMAPSRGCGWQCHKPCSEYQAAQVYRCVLLPPCLPARAGLRVWQRERPTLVRACAGHAWSRRWWALIEVGAQRSVAETLLGDGGVDLHTSGPTTAAPPFWWMSWRAHGAPVSRSPLGCRAMAPSRVLI